MSVFARRRTPRPRLAAASAAAAAGLLIVAPGAGANQPADALAAWTAGNPTTSSLVWRLDPAGPVVIAEYQPDRARPPASTEKLMTAAGALIRLGPDHRFQTRLFTSAGARREGRVLRGPLFLQGGGDPVLATGDYARTYLNGRGGNLVRLTRPLRRLGIRRVRGPIVADESIFDARRLGPQWRPYYARYAPPLSGLTTNQNYSGDARSSYVTDPAIAAGQRLRASLTGVGVAQRGSIRVGRTPPRGRLLATTHSPPLRAIVRLMNPASDNHIAETLLKDIGALATGRGTSAAGAAEVGAVLRSRGILGRGDRIVDGSGLSRANRLSATSLVRLIAAADADPAWGRALIDSMARGGEGTLIRRFPGAAGPRVRAKTGYINGVSALAGRVVSRGGRHYAFAMLMESWDVAGAHATQDRVVALLASGAADRL